MKRSASQRRKVALIVRDTRRYGKGVFAGQDIRKGQVIHVLSGKRLDVVKLVDRILSSKEYIDDPFQIGLRTYLDLDAFSRTFNHSCSPNAGLRNASELFALRDIEKGEEITYDYSLTIAPTDWSMRCKCGATGCRKVLHDVRSIPKAQLRKYRDAGAVQRYMKGILKQLDTGPYKLPPYEVRALQRLAGK